MSAELQADGWPVLPPAVYQAPVFVHRGELRKEDICDVLQLEVGAAPKTSVNVRQLWMWKTGVQHTVKPTIMTEIYMLIFLFIYIVCVESEWARSPPPHVYSSAHSLHCGGLRLIKNPWEGSSSEIRVVPASCRRRVRRKLEILTVKVSTMILCTNYDSLALNLNGFLKELVSQHFWPSSEKLTFILFGEESF